jgi:hypothetical protein
MSATTSRKNERKRIVQPQYASLRLRFADGSLVAMREMDRLEDAIQKCKALAARMAECASGSDDATLLSALNQKGSARCARFAFSPCIDRTNEFFDCAL